MQLPGIMFMICSKGKAPRTVFLVMHGPAPFVATTAGDTIHQTGEAYALFKRTADMKINLDGATIPVGNLAVVPQPMGGNFAN